MKYTLAVLFATVIALFPKPLVAIQNELDGTGRIYNGHVAKPGQFPWLAAIWVKWGQIGSATLICDSWVLTNSQCLTEGKIEKVYLGAFNTSKADEPGRVVTGTVQQIIHEKYDILTGNNDIALIELKDKVTFTDRIKPIPLGADYIPANVNLTLSGWGWNGVGPRQLSPVILFTDETSISNHECKEAFGRYDDLVFNTTLCCKGVPHHGPAVGDAGDPLIHIGQDGKAVHVAGSSFCCPLGGCGHGGPSAYTRTANYIDWIIEKINGTCTLP